MGTCSCSPSVAATARKKFPSKARAIPTEQIMMLLPGGFKRAAMPVEINQRGAGQRSGLDSHPKQPEVLAYSHDRHHSQEKQETAGEGALSGIGEKRPFLKILPSAPVFSLKVAQGVNCHHEKERTRDAQKKQAGSIEKHPAIQKGGRPFTQARAVKTE